MNDRSLPHVGFANNNYFEEILARVCGHDATNGAESPADTALLEGDGYASARACIYKIAVSGPRPRMVARTQ